MVSFGDPLSQRVKGQALAKPRNRGTPNAVEPEKRRDHKGVQK